MTLKVTMDVENEKYKCFQANSECICAIVTNSVIYHSISTTTGYDNRADPNQVICN